MVGKREGLGLIDFRKIVGEIEGLVARVVLPDEVRDALAVARELLERGNAAEAARVVEPLVEKFPKLSEPCVFLGLAREREGAMALAGEALERALKRGARPEDVLPALGRAREAMGDMKGAEDAYHEAARFSADDVEVQLGLARIALWAGAWERAAAILRRCDAARADVALFAVVADFRLGEFDAALRRIRAVESPTAEIACWEGRALLAKGDASGAAAAFQRLTRAGGGPASQSTLAAALVGEARAQGDLGREGEALSAALRARALEPSRETLALAAEGSEPAVALALLEEGLGMPAAKRTPWDPMPTGLDAVDLHLAAGEAALAARDDERLSRHLDEARKLGATERATANLEARHAERRGDHAAAEALWMRCFELTGDAAALVGAGRAAVQAGRFAVAEAALGRAATLAPNTAGLREALTTLYRHAEPTALDSLDALCRRFREIAARAGDVEIADAAADLATDLGRPLTLAVMGEFSAGKSTFVNALLGAEVLPVGVTPTTATVNVIRYGAERAARVVWADGRVEPIPWSELAAAIDRRLGADPRVIREVEIDWPAPELLDVSILDTPGFNAVAEGHEQRAAELLKRADAVVWLFDAGQAGRASEIEPLERLASLGVRVLGVLNKADRLSPADAEKVIGLLRRVAPTAVSVVVPCSAKRALQGRVASNDAEVTASGFVVLRATLDAEFFSKARKLKRDAVQRRLTQGVRASRARLVEREATLAENLERIALAEKELAEIANSLGAALCDGLLADLRGTLERALAEVARESVRFVEPANAFRGARLRDESQGVVAASLAALVFSATDHAAGDARAKLDVAVARANEVWRPLMPADAGQLFTRYGDAVRDLFVARTLDRYRAELGAVVEGRAALALLRSAVDESRGEAKAFAAALHAAIPPLGGALREALRVGVEGVRAALLAPAEGLRRSIDREGLLMRTSWAEPLSAVERELETLG